jgi:hypothetical protein
MAHLRPTGRLAGRESACGGAAVFGETIPIERKKTFTKLRIDASSFSFFEAWIF